MIPMAKVVQIHPSIEVEEGLAADELVFEFVPNSLNEETLVDLVNGSRMRGHVLMHWAGYPNLRKSTEVLMQLIGSQWERETGVPLILEAIESATDEALRVVSEDGGSYRTVIGRYLNCLGDIASSIVLYRTCGLVKGKWIQWEPLARSLPEWIAAEKVERVCVYKGGVASRDLVEGIKTRYLSQSCSPQDLGIAIRYR